MKTLELTEEQCVMLVEMAKAMFPEYKDITTKSNYRDTGKPRVANIEVVANFVLLPGIGWSNIDDYIGFTSMHWFEFCLTHLFKKIYDVRYALDTYNDFRARELQEMIIYSHPVEHLYEEYRSLIRCKLLK